MGSCSFLRIVFLFNRDRKLGLLVFKERFSCTSFLAGLRMVCTDLLFSMLDSNEWDRTWI